MEASKIEKYSLHDGRRAERRVFETTSDVHAFNVKSNCEEETVTEYYAEEERPLFLQERVHEKKKPFIYERVYEKIDQEGNIVEQKTESTDPGSRMHVVDHIGLAHENISAQNYMDDCDCHVTKEEMIEAVIAGVRAAKVEDYQSVTPVPRPSVPRPKNEINSLGLADQITERQSTELSTTDKVLMGLIVAMAVGLVYVVFMM